jgi:hypothetical protein
VADAQPGQRVHQVCRHRIGGRPSERDRIREVLSLPASWVHPAFAFLRRMAGGAENFTDEGLTYIENIFPRQTQALPASLYLGLFTGASNTTVPARTVVLGGTPPITGVVEPTAGTGAYARAQVTNASWGAPVVAGSGVETVSAQISLAESTGSGFSPSTQNGFLLTQQLAQGSGSIGLGYANFSDTTAVNVNAAGYVLRLTPTYHWDV